MNKNTNIISYPIKTRESNIELLRIVAMFMVMILHIICNHSIFRLDISC